ncbi:MAG: hypothetical protein IBX47_12145, partial [Desulfuromonadales bacterium]|nr:hypothetical protein [Desulfuromonadales bacterium]
IYRAGADNDQRMTFGNGNRSQAAIQNGLLVYADFSNGLEFPDLAFLDLVGGKGGTLSAHPAKQEEPAVGDGHVVWQDNRDGVWQIYTSPLEVSALPIEVTLQPGFNLVAIGQKLIDSYPNAAALIAPHESGPVIEKTMRYNANQADFYAADSAGGDFALQKGAGLILYAQKAGTLQVADSGETATYTLLPDTNHIGLLTVPFGYRARALMNSVGLENIQSVRRFDNINGRWQTASVRTVDGLNEIVGENFTINSGDGVVVTMKTLVNGWKP